MEESQHETPSPVHAHSTSYESSPPKPFTPHVAAHKRAELECLFPDAEKTVKASRMLELLREGVPSTQFSNIPSPTLGFNSDRDYVRYLNNLSSLVYNAQDYQKLGYRIKFFACGNQANDDHPTGTKCRPDFVAVMQDVDVPVDSDDDPEVSSPAPKFCWSQIEATGENKSKGKSRNNAHLQAASYTGYLLQARPDLVSVLGIFVDPKQFKLLLTNACGVYFMEPVTWKSSDAGNLLCAWIHRLYHPEVDASITRLYEPKPTPTPASASTPAPTATTTPAPTVTPTHTHLAKFPSEPVFMIRHKGTEYNGCKILKVGSPFHRRTTIFETSDGKVIKDQYIEPFRRHEEGPILDHIHTGGPFPGVVQYESYDVVKRTPLTSDGLGSVQPGVEVELLAVCGDEKRKKTRLVMPERGELLMDVKTPWEVLILAYDLLEVMRHLYTKRNVLHRDISVNNVLCRPKYLEMDPALEKEFPEMCFAAHLLREKEPETKAEFGRLATKLMLIDYDMSQNCGKKTAEQPTPRTGTFIFMARSVRSRQVSEGVYLFPPMPQLDSFVKTRYEECVRGRLKAFPANIQTLHYEDQTRDIKPFRHKLAYDVESVFWVLLYYFMQAQPAPASGQQKVKDPLKRDYWNGLTGGDDENDSRSNQFIDGRFPVHLFHQSYQQLEPLFKSMADQLKGDPEILEETDPRRKKEEYLIEAFQRLILSFLFKHSNHGFMHIEKDPDPRELTPDRFPAQDLSTNQLTSAKGSGPNARGSGSRARGSDSHNRGSGPHKRGLDSADQDSVQGQEPASKKSKPNESPT